MAQFRSYRKRPHRKRPHRKRSYRKIVRFRRQIGQYISDEEVARLARYVTLD